jgi:hypothetical protein
LQQTTNDGVGGSLQNFSDTPLRTALAVKPGYFDFDTVFMQNCAHLIVRQINIWGTTVSLDKSMTIAMA